MPAVPWKAWLFVLSAAAAVCGQVVLTSLHPSPLPYRITAIGLGTVLVLWGLLFVRRTVPPPGRLPVALITAAVLWLTVVELFLLCETMLARGFLGLAAAAMVHFLVLIVITRPDQGRGRLERVILKAGLLLSATLLLLFGVECVFRLVVPLQLYEIIPDDPSKGTCLIETAFGGHQARPGFRGKYMHPQFPGIRVEINDYGFRDGLDEAGPPGPHEISILVLGDSLAFGTGVSLEDTFQERIEAMGAAISRSPLRVYCAAVPGSAPYHHLDLLADLLAKIRPHLVIEAVYEGNDFNENLRAEAMAANRLSGGEKDLESERSGGPDLLSFLRGVTRSSFWKGSSATVQWNFPAVETALIEFGLIQGNAPSNRFLSECMEREPSNWVIVSQDRTIHHLETMRKKCQLHGAELVVLVIPALIQADPTSFDRFLLRRPKAMGDRYHRTKFHEEFVKGLERKGLLFVDMLAPLEAAFEAGDTPYHREGHWNARGHAMAAEQLALLLKDLLERR